MKKALIFIGLFLMIISSCASSFYYNYEELKNNVISAEIIEIKWDNNEEKITETYIVNDEKLDELLNDLASIEIFSIYGNPVKPEGLCLKLYYKDYYEIVHCYSIRKYENTGDFISIRHIGMDKKIYDALVEKYK